MGIATKMATLTLVRVASIIGKQTGIGFAVDNKALTSNVATLTTSTAHGLAAADVVEVRGVDSTFDGRRTVVSTPTSTTFTYACVASNVSSAAVSPTGCVSKRLSIGHRRWGDTENFEASVAALAAETQGHFRLALKSVGTMAMDAMPARIIGSLHVFVGKDTNSDLINAWELAITIAQALTTESNYDITTGEMWPKEVTYSFHKLEVLENKGIAIFDFGEYGGGGIEFLDP